MGTSGGGSFLPPLLTQLVVGGDDVGRRGLQVGSHDAQRVQPSHIVTPDLHAAAARATRGGDGEMREGSTRWRKSQSNKTKKQQRLKKGWNDLWGERGL